MGLFQQTILKKQMLAGSEKIRKAYELYAAYFLNPEIQENIRNSKEEQFQEGFLRELFVKIFGYTLNPEQCARSTNSVNSSFTFLCKTG